MKGSGQGREEATPLFNGSGTMAMRIRRLADMNDAGHDGDRCRQVEADDGQQIRLAAENGDEDRRADRHFCRHFGQSELAPDGCSGTAAVLRSVAERT